MSRPPALSALASIDTSPLDLLFTDPTSGIVVTFHENERPLLGLAGLVDWRFHGAISEYLKAGAISGKAGECAYLPMTLNGRTYHLILIGAGDSETPGLRRPLENEMLAPLSKNLASLKLPLVAISKSDFGNPPAEYFERAFRAFKGGAICIAQ